MRVRGLGVFLQRLSGRDRAGGRDGRIMALGRGEQGVGELRVPQREDGLVGGGRVLVLVGLVVAAHGVGGVEQDGGGTAGGGEQGAQGVVWVDVARVVVRVAGDIRNVRLSEPLGVAVAHDDQPASDAKVLRCVSTAVSLNSYSFT